MAKEYKQQDNRSLTEVYRLAIKTGFEEDTIVLVLKDKVFQRVENFARSSSLFYTQQDLEDISQNVLVSLIEHIGEYSNLSSMIKSMVLSQLSSAREYETLNQNLNEDTIQLEGFEDEALLRVAITKAINSLSHLSDRSKDIVQMYLEDSLSFIFIGKKYGITEERARQVFKEALRQLRKAYVIQKVQKAHDESWLSDQDKKKIEAKVLSDAQKVVEYEFESEEPSASKAVSDGGNDREAISLQDLLIPKSSDTEPENFWDSIFGRVKDDFIKWLSEFLE